MLINKYKSRGFSMLEVLVTLVIILIGVLGVAGMQMLPDGANNYFYDVSVEVPAADTSSFSLKAVPVGSQTKDTVCATYTYNSRGIRGNYGGTASDSCWK